MCAVSSMAHRGRRSEESIEFRKARQFCFGHSKFDSKLQERTFIGTPEAVKAFVEAAEIIEAGYEYVCEMDSQKLFRKRK